MSEMHNDGMAPPADLLTRLPTGPWSTDAASTNYGVSSWGASYFAIDPDGNLCAKIPDDSGESPTDVPLLDAISELQSEGLGSPLMIRFPAFLDAGLSALNQAFTKAIESHDYAATYRGVFPIKVNQQRQVLDEIASYGSRFGVGFEAGSKPELIAALAYLHRPGSLLVCNGYKDEQFVRLALMGKRLGFDVVLVVEMPQELDTIIRCAEEMDIEPSIGFRLKLSAEGYGYWKNSAGERSPFGINSSQLLELTDRLRNEGRAHWISMLHCHQGSQITELKTVERSANEACRVYAQLRAEGIEIRYVNFGGGLAVDYAGLGKDDLRSPDYTVNDYADVLVATMKRITTEANVAPADIITESGRAIAAPYAALVAKVHDVATFEVDEGVDIALPDDCPGSAIRLNDLLERIDDTDLDGAYLSAIKARDAALADFAKGEITLRERALCERIYWKLLSAILAKARRIGRTSTALTNLDAILADQAYANFSIFQSLPDSWAIGQIFPVVPLQRLDEKPTRRCLVNDMTCDCDGAIKHYPTAGGVSDALMLHDISDGEDYYIGVFLVGAYQETLSDLHNLFGDIHVISVTAENGKAVFSRVLEGESVGDALETVKHSPRELSRMFRHNISNAIKEKKLASSERNRFTSEYDAGLHSYTYLSEQSDD